MKQRFKLRLYHAKDGWRYTLKKNGRKIDATTQGYARRDAALRNIAQKLEAYGQLSLANWRTLGTHRDTVVEIFL